MADLTTSAVQAAIDYERSLDDQIVYRGFTRAELDAAFQSVQNAVNWKYPVCSIVHEDERARVEAAIEFYAGGGADFRPVPAAANMPGYLEVRAPGYYALIGA